MAGLKYLIIFTNGTSRIVEAPNVSVAAEVAWRYFALLYGYGELLAAHKLPTSTATR